MTYRGDVHGRRDISWEGVEGGGWGGSWKGKQGVQGAIVVLSRIAWELGKALDADTLCVCSYSLYGGGVYTRTSGPHGAPILLRLEMLSRVHRGTATPWD